MGRGLTLTQDTAVLGRSVIAGPCVLGSCPACPECSLSCHSATNESVVRVRCTTAGWRPAGPPHWTSQWAIRSGAASAPGQEGEQHRGQRCVYVQERQKVLTLPLNNVREAQASYCILRGHAPTLWYGRHRSTRLFWYERCCHKQSSARGCAGRQLACELFY